MGRRRLLLAVAIIVTTLLAASASVLAGDVPLVQVGDLVWQDSNANGIQDGGEPGLAGVEVQLLDEDYLWLRSSFTGADGFYSFGGLPAGEAYHILVLRPEDYAFSPAQQGSDAAADSDVNPATGMVDIVASEDDDSVDVGLYPDDTVATIRGWVFHDLNADGIWVEGEPSLNGWEIVARQDATEVARVVTRTNHAWSSSPGYYELHLPPGTYTLWELEQEGWYQSSPADPAYACVTIPSGGAEWAEAFGNYQKITITACRLRDMDGLLATEYDQVPNAGGVLRLHCDGDLIDTGTAGEDGCYTWTGLMPGHSYAVGEMLPPTWVALTGEYHDFGYLASGTGPYSYTFINAVGASIGDYVWRDSDYDGVQDECEDGIAGVTVRLLDESKNVLREALTGPEGQYQMSGVAPGTYYLRFVTPTKHLCTLMDQGDDALDSDANPADSGIAGPFTLASGDVRTDLDAGMWLVASVGNQVWVDENHDGLNNCGEVGLAGVNVSLLDDGDNVIMSTTTDGSGHYLFSLVPPGQYRIQFALPTGYFFTPNDVGTDDSIDNDADMATGLTGSFAIVEGISQIDWDAGVYEGMDIEGRKLSGDVDEALPGWTIELYRVNPPIPDTPVTELIGTAVTDENGYYCFSGLPMGDYLLYEEEQDGWLQLYPAAGFYEVSLPKPADSPSSYIFVNKHLFDISGFKYNGDTDEPIAGWTVKLYVLDPEAPEPETWDYVTQTTTGPDGKYCFEDLVAGTYRVEEVMPAWWLPEGDAAYVVDLPAGRSDRDDGPSYDFHNIYRQVETAWAKGERYVKKGNWAMYVPYANAAKTVDLIAVGGSTATARVIGTATFSAPHDGLVTVTVNLVDGWIFWDDPADAVICTNLKVQDYNKAPTKTPSPGLFVWRMHFDAGVTSGSIDVPVNKYYGVHLDVALTVPPQD